MANIAHPAAGEELAHLDSTLAIIRTERGVSMQELKHAEEELATARRFEPDALPLREMMYAKALQNVRNMDLARAKPYFTRIDFIEKGGDAQRYYIGKYGVLRSDVLEVEVVDWRAPVANLYYSGQIGPMNYVAPDGTVEGELTLKRQFGIEDGRLETIFDTDIVSQDAYLQSVLGASTGDRLREIVTTIQAEQNFVIRYPLNRSLIVQGVAGSGKTTIALHRIAYLLYAFGDQLRPEHMLILAPNPLFLNFIAGILPDLGVERVQQTTFSRLLAGLLSKALPKCETGERLDTILSLDPDELARRTRIAQAKGSLLLFRLLTAFMDRYEDAFPLVEGILYGPVKLFSVDWQRQFLLVDEKPFPMARRLDEFKKQLKGATHGAAQLIIRKLNEQYDRDLYELNRTERDPDQRKARVKALREKFDWRVEEVKKRVAPFIKDTMKRFPTLDPALLYRAFWEDALSRGELAEAARYTLERLDKKLPLEPEDLASVALIAMRFLELKRLDIRHIVVDEAQDFSPMEFLLLKQFAPRATMTVVGDLMQGVNGWRGLTDWGVLEDAVFEGQAAKHFLVTSYRNTIEIMNAAIKVAEHRPTPGQQVAKPVLRHGEPPRFVRVDGEADRVARIVETVRAWKAAGLSTIAVIDRSEKRLAAMLKKVPVDLGAGILDVNAEAYEGGVVFAPASAVKGLEFDGVILADVSADSFRDADLDARLLYVCMTRALHRMECVWKGELTALLR